jgi:cytochrome P450
MDYQRAANPLATALRSQVNWQTFGNEINPWHRWHPIRPIIQWYNGKVMSTYIRVELKKRFEELKANRGLASKPAAKSVIGLALEAYAAAHGKNEILDQAQLDEEFAAFATYQIRLFLFAGHDSTSSTLVYAYHLLSKHPKALSRVREEHAKVFGDDPAVAAERLRQTPSLVNQTPYTLAVIKETLRLFPAASSMREGQREAMLTDTAGRTYPTDQVLVWIVHLATQTNPRVWPRAREFVPERWLVDPGHELYPPPNAFRTFEHGPRNCIGQTLVYVELRVALIMTVRQFDIRPAYAEIDAERARQDGLLGFVLNGRGFFKEPTKTFRGERAYQIEKGGAHPSEGYPCRVRRYTGY